MPPVTLAEVDYLKSIWVALRRIEQALESQNISAPIVHVAPPDLSEVTSLLRALPGSLTAEDLSQVLQSRPVSNGAENVNSALSEVAEALKLLEFRMQGMGVQAYGGGSVTLQRGQTVGISNLEESGLAKDATLLRRYGDHVTKAGVVSSTGDNTLHTPAAGNRIRLYWIGLSTSQDNVAENLIQVKLTDADGTVKYRWRMGNPGAFVGGRTIEGNVDEPLILNLATTDPVDWNIDLEEVT
jgi:hypothetical protein